MCKVCTFIRGLFGIAMSPSFDNIYVTKHESIKKPAPKRAGFKI